MYFKHAVDAMGTRNGAAVTAAVAALLTSGLCRIVNGVAKELQHPFFTPVSQVQPRQLTCSAAAMVCQWPLLSTVPHLVSQSNFRVRTGKTAWFQPE